jgi:hypothetical protein
MRILLAAAALMLLVSGCGSVEPEPEKPSDDGKLRPPPNGVRTTETAACNALSAAHSKTLLGIGCVGTTRDCPSWVRTQSGADCLQYDQGSLEGCIAHIKEQTTCADLAASVDECIVYAYADSGPAGCP